MKTNDKQGEGKPQAEAAPPREPRRYEPPRLTRRRSVARATLFSGSGPDAGGVVG